MVFSTRKRWFTQNVPLNEKDDAQTYYRNVLIQQFLLYLKGKAVLLWPAPGVTRTLKTEH